MGRGMKKWAPYKTLTEQYDALYKLRKDKTKIERPTISNERAEEINEILTNYNNEELVFTIYKKGEIITFTSPIIKFDLTNRLLICKDSIKIYLKDIVNLEIL